MNRQQVLKQRAVRKGIYLAARKAPSFPREGQGRGWIAPSAQNFYLLGSRAAILTV